MASWAGIKSLVKSPPTAEAMLPALVKGFAESNSFDMTRERFDLLRRVPASWWTPERVASVRQRAQENTQLSNANLRTGQPVPDALEELWRQQDANDVVVAATALVLRR
jgi:hypothetical protein